MPRHASSSPPARVSLEVIARELNVSVATVSRVLNEKPGISDEVRQRVSKALDQHAYRRRGSRPTSTGSGVQTVAFVVSSDLFFQISQGNEFYGRHLFSVQKAISEAGYYPLVITAEQDVDAAGQLRCVAERRVQAVIGESQDLEVMSRTAREVPTVLFNRVLPGMDCVCTNMRAAAQEELQYLYNLGHRSMAMFRMPLSTGVWENVDFWQQYLAFMEIHELPVPRVFLQPPVFGPHGEEEAAWEFIQKVLPEGATAILTYDSYAPAILNALKRKKVRVPEEVSVVGFNDLREVESLGLTTYRQDFDALGREAMRLLLERSQRRDAPPRLLQLPGELIIRGSTAAAPSPNG